MPFELVRQYTSEQLELFPVEKRQEMWNAGDLTRDADNQHHAVGASGIKVSIRETDGARGRMFVRRAVKFPSDGPSYQVDVLVAELDGVRVYVDERNSAVIITREDLML
jgi:hypothetical protein